MPFDVEEEEEEWNLRHDDRSREGKSSPYFSPGKNWVKAVARLLPPSPPP